MAKVSLYGHLAQEFGSTFQLNVKSPKEAIRALIANFPSFKTSLAPGEYYVMVDDLPTDESGLSFPVGARQHIKIVPAVSGAKRGLFSVIAGIALIAAAVFVPGLQGLAAYAVGGLGGALVMSGMASMLTPTPNKAEQGQAVKIENKYFSAPANTEAQGNPVPLAYGEVMTGSRVISSGLLVE